MKHPWEWDQETNERYHKALFQSLLRIYKNDAITQDNVLTYLLMPDITSFIIDADAGVMRRLQEELYTESVEEIPETIDFFKREMQQLLKTDNNGWFYRQRCNVISNQTITVSRNNKTYNYSLRDVAKNFKRFASIIHNHVYHEQKPLGIILYQVRESLLPSIGLFSIKNPLFQYANINNN